MGDTLSIGIVGTGVMARTMANLVSVTPGAKVGAVLSRDAERSRDFAAGYGEATGTKDPGAFFAAGLDAVYVGSANEAHLGDVERCLDARLPCLVEKPLTTSATGTRELCDRADRDGVLLMENLWTLCLPTHLALKRTVTASRYGGARHLTFDFSLPVDPADQPRLFDQAAGGVVLDRAIYGLGLALDLFGPIREMDSRVTRGASGIDTSCSLQTVHDDGVTAQGWVSIDGFGGNTVDLALQSGHIRLGPPAIGAEWLTSAAFSGAGASSAGTQDGGVGLKARIKSLPLARKHLGRAARTDERRQFLSYGDSPYRPALDHFLGLVRQGAPESPIVPRALSLAAMEAIDTILATGTGRPDG